MAENLKLQSDFISEEPLFGFVAVVLNLIISKSGFLGFAGIGGSFGEEDVDGHKDGLKVAFEALLREVFVGLVIGLADIEKPGF